MKTIVFVVSVMFYPGDFHMEAHPYYYSEDMKTEEACQSEVRFWENRWKNGSGQPMHGRIGNLPGYRLVEAAWCEDPDEPWPGSTVPLKDGTWWTQGPYAPKDKGQRDHWTPVTGWPPPESVTKQFQHGQDGR